MEWYELYTQSNQPTDENIEDFIQNELWSKFNEYLKETYHVKPKLSYSSCSMQKGWNVKYQKSGRSLCTLYPMDGYFIALVVIGEKEKTEAELMLPLLSYYTKNLYQQTAFFNGCKWLMIKVNDSQILEDTVNLIRLRVNSKR